MPKIARTALFSLIVITASVIAYAAASEQFDYGTVRWGMTGSEVAQAIGGTYIADSNWLHTTRKYYGFEIKGRYSLSGALLKYVFIEMNGDAWSFATNDLIKTYGPCATNFRDIMDNSIKVFEWRTKRTTIHARKESMKVSISYFCDVDLSGIRKQKFGSSSKL